MLVAGAPCQGFSQLNHHPGSQPVMEKVGNAVPHPGTGSLLKNSVVASFLSYGI
jgi:hypothetical protein